MIQALAGIAGLLAIAWIFSEKRWSVPASSKDPTSLAEVTGVVISFETSSFGGL